MGTLGVEASPSAVQSIYNQSDRLEDNFKFLQSQIVVVPILRMLTLFRFTWEGLCHFGTQPCQDARRQPFLDEPQTSLFATASAPRCSPVQTDFRWGYALYGGGKKLIHSGTFSFNLVFLMEKSLTVAHFCFVGQTEGLSRIM